MPSQAGWKETFSMFMTELKNLVARDLSSAGGALKRAFDLLNQFRLQIGIDNYGMVGESAQASPISMIC